MLGTPLKAEYLHTAVTVRGPFESRAGYLHIAIAVWGQFESILLTHNNDCWRPLFRVVTRLDGARGKKELCPPCLPLYAPAALKAKCLSTHCSCCWGPLETEYLHIAFLLGAHLKAV